MDIISRFNKKINNIILGFPSLMILNFTNFKWNYISVEAHLKSEPIPQFNNGPVKIAVTKNFDEIVTNNGKDTLIKFYAPWCLHCQKLAPIYDEVGLRLKQEDVEIVKMDASKNDVPLIYYIPGYPTIYWVPKNKKNAPIHYSGGRSVEAIIKYVAKSATDELKYFDRKGNRKKINEL